MNTYGIKELKVTDLPRDNYNVCGSLRATLCKVFNYCRKFPYKLALLKSVLLHVLAEIEKAEKLIADAEKTETKAKTTKATTKKATVKKETK